MPLFLDLPAPLIDSLDVVIAGWVAAPHPDIDLHVCADGERVSHARHDRPDVRAAFPDLPFCTGFNAIVDISNAQGACFEISVTQGQEKIVHRARLTERLIAERQRETSLREAARSWCLKNILCPHCRNPDARPQGRGPRLVCTNCGMEYRQFNQKLDFLAEDMRFALLPDAETTSANPYDPAARALIEDVTAQGGVVLDCGAGSRPMRTPGVINLEIVAYRSTDILSAGERLPFKDASFDAILSLAVLEHVRDPFACAREMLRVIKPGGKIMCSVPFLQPEHNFPGHFYNMTQTGLENLFAGKAELLSAEVPLHGHPIFAVQWILRDYLAGLPEDARETFARMTIGEAAASDPAAQLTHDFATSLSPAALRRIACLNTLVFRRPLSAAA
jgi:hypothetical protein